MNSSNHSAQNACPGSTDVQSIQLAEAMPWEGLVIPDGFELDSEGVHKISHQGHRQKICGPLWVDAKTRDISGKGWGQHLSWINQDGRMCECSFPSQQLHERGLSPVIRRLADEGLQIIPSRENDLLKYIGSFNSTERINSTAQTGWLTTSNSSLTFVLPHKVISTDENLSVAFQPEQFSPSADSLHSKGSQKQWQAQVARYCQGNPVLMFSICAALTPALLKFVEMDCFGIHLYGKSSQGKTTTLQVAASTWGNGADPAASPQSNIQRWNTTANALEGIAAAHNDGFLALDEMGTFSGPDFGPVVYNLMGGQGKARMNDRAGMQRIRTWRLVALSTGEISIQEKIEESGRKAKAGQLNRFLDIPVSDRIIQNSHGMTPGKLSDELKEACGRCYGVLGPVFIECIVNSSADFNAAQGKIKHLMNEYTAQLTGSIELESHQKRGLKRFGLICAAAHLAIDFKLLPWTRNEAINAITDIANTWLAANTSDAMRGILSVRSFILQHQDSKFRTAQEQTYSSSPLVHDIAGYFIPGKRLYALTPEGFKRACGGLDPRTVADALDKNGLLFKNERNRMMAKLSIPETSNRLRVYAVKSEILDIDLKGDD